MFKKNPDRKTTLCRPGNRWKYSSVKWILYFGSAEYSQMKVTVNIMGLLVVTSN